MEFGSIEREIHVDATPEVVYEVVSTPEHLRGWWPDEAEFESAPGGTGTFRFGDGASPDAHVVALTVVEADPPRRFSFRWMHEPDETATPGNSLLITFDLVPSGAGTLLRLTETGFREQGWEAAVLEEQYRDHVTGWDHYLPRLAPYASGLVQAP
ncbi:SRPBCC family protein [Streptacidiphilus melanogenes]|uniref:SRPBCC family protein n=1 Tax=Streptacidiphilus melanogenes TaxID=411235 RepID=UPI0005A9B5DD|nr:SRPBCC family protein [Streptacidiphilus melanogenes]